MRCEDIQNELVSFVLNELESDEREVVENHLASCEKCRLEVGEYQHTLRALGQWKVPSHAGPPLFALLPEKSKTRKTRLLESARQFVRYGIDVAFAAVIVAALLMGIHIQYANGGLSINIGHTVAQCASPDSVRVAALLDDAHRKDLQLFSEMIAESEARQNELYRSSLTSFARQLGDQQRGYMTYLATHLYQLQQQNELAYYQSQVALSGVIKLANAVK